jgi:hypothetical protein
MTVKRGKLATVFALQRIQEREELILLPIRQGIVSTCYTRRLPGMATDGFLFGDGLVIPISLR